MVTDLARRLEVVDGIDALERGAQVSSDARKLPGWFADPWYLGRR